MGTDKQAEPLTDAGKKLLRYDKSALAYILAIEVEAADLFEKQTHAARERPSALDGRAVHRAWRDGMLAQGREVAPERMAWETLTQQDRDLDDGIAARLTEPDAGGGTERPAGSIYPFIDKYDDSYQAPTPDTTEATLRAALIGLAFERRSTGELCWCGQTGVERHFPECLAARAALQQPAVQPEPER